MSVMMFKALGSKCSLAQLCVTSFSSVVVPLQFIMRACVMLKSLTRKDEHPIRKALAESFVILFAICPLFVIFMFVCFANSL